MYDSSFKPTPYEDINITLYHMLASIQAILGDMLKGFYLYGSLSLGDFTPNSSDLDFLIVVTEPISEEIFDRLATMHQSLASSKLPYTQKLEGSYIPMQALRRYNPPDIYHPTIGIDWPFQIQGHGSNWILERHIIREYGIVVWGPPPYTLIDPITPTELQDATYEQLIHFWQHQLDEPDWLRPRDYQAFAILTLCRALYTLQQGKVCSKPQAAQWAFEHYPRWKPIIELAMAWRFQHDEGDLTETMNFLKDALALAKTIYLSNQTNKDNFKIIQ